MNSLSRVRLFATPWTVAHQAPPSMAFSRQEYWSGLPFLLQGIFPTQGLNPGLPHSGQTLYHLRHQGDPKVKSLSEVAQSCPTLCDPMDCSLPGSSHGILQARVLEWVAISFSRGSPNPGIQPWSSAFQADTLTSEPPGKERSIIKETSIWGVERKPLEAKLQVR